ncbi:MAG: hypothetical protein SCALA702_21980 [Melioribacteraceae bacterium]|nr:MAG: hypothetical protein SCALA702_21980 [Melioribacteraceae bacterium]
MNSKDILLNESYYKELFKKQDNLFIVFLTFQVGILLISFLYLDNIDLSVKIEQPRIIFYTIVFNSILVGAARKKRSKKAGVEEFNDKFNAYVSRSRMGMYLMATAQLWNMFAYTFMPGWELLLVMILLIVLTIVYRPSKDEFIKVYELQDTEILLVKRF